MQFELLTGTQALAVKAADGKRCEVDLTEKVPEDGLLYEDTMLCGKPTDKTRGSETESSSTEAEENAIEDE